MQRYYSLSDYLKQTYGKKLVKLSLDGGFSCPNRDGTLSTKGCVFCSEEGAGDFSGLIVNGTKCKTESISDQIESQKQLLSSKWKDCGYIGYFQNYTNTYKPIEALESLYAQALACEGVEGLVIATRPDCINASHIALFKKSRVMWIELGLQTIHDEKAGWLNRHYDLQSFETSYNALNKAGIPVVVHLIAGLPNENRADFLASIEYLSSIKPFGVKLHMLHVVRNTPLGKIYQENPFELLSEAIYVEWIVDAIRKLHPDIVIHRLTGDGKKSDLIAPKWILNKRHVLNSINKRLDTMNIMQGDLLKQR
ncbi:TIGR01212 family radical SAM protein [Fusibacter bizertensis]